jgi:2-oxoglutarate ferredoxin oxidoreductase subunit beta
MKLLFGRPNGLTPTNQRYCPGCGHGIVHRIIGDVLVNLNIRERTLGIAPVGCSVFADEYFNCDMIQPPHGRGPAVATGMKRARPECIVFSYQGDGDLASIGTAEIIHAAARNENITVIFINNAIFGMTGGQLAPTTLPGMRSTTSVKGRDVTKQGYPIKVCELLAGLDGPYYLERVSVHAPKHILKAEKAIKTAFQNQIDNKGFSLVEILSLCPTGWGLTPVDAKKWMEDVMSKYYPTAEYRNRGKEAK